MNKFFDAQYPSGFPTLSRAPIAEAVIDFRVFSQHPWNPDKLKNSIKEIFPKAKKIEATNEFIYKVSLSGEPPKEERIGCVGYKILCENERHIVQFNQKGFVLSWVKDYKDWPSFVDQVEIYWKMYCDLLFPDEVKRIGVRFINKMVIKNEPPSLKEYYIYPPSEKQIDDWDLTNFLHKESFVVPQTQYKVTLIKTISRDPKGLNKAVIFDSDVYVVQSISCAWGSLSEHLCNIRDIKNKAFFGNIVKTKIEEYIE